MKNIRFVVPSKFFLPALLAVFVFGAHAAQAKVITVDDNGADCRKADFTSIQAAVNAASSGDTIKVCAGTYVEQVTIPAGKNGLTLRSHVPEAAIIKAPPAMADPKAIMRVNGAQDVTINGFTIAGPGGGPCDSLRYGVRVDGGGSATISQNHIVNIRDTPFSGCQNGHGILVGRVSEGQTGRATIFKNKIDGYQKGGIVISNVGSSAEITDNEITGIGPTAAIAQNGVQISGGATAIVRNNEIAQNQYTPMTFASAGILLFEPGAVTVEHNTLSHNDESVYSQTAANPAIQHNKISFNTFDGIGLLATTGAIVSNNFSENNGYDGIYVSSDSTGNTITNNQMEANAEHDAHDDSNGPGTAGTANTWEKNHCGSLDPENRPGLCDHNH